MGLRLKRGSATDWSTANPVLEDGEVGIESPATAGAIPKFKVGDGTTAWNSLPYFGGTISGTAGGDLTGTYPNPTIAANAVTASKIANATITDTQVAAANKDGTAATPSMRTLGTGSTQAAAGNDSRFSDSRSPTGAAGGDLSGTYPNPTIGSLVVTAAKIANATITDTQVAAANKDGTAATPSLRTLGTGATQAAAGNDSRFSDSRSPTGAAGGDLSGTYPNPSVAALAITAAKIASATITDTQVAAANKDGTAATPSMRTLGTGSTQAAAGNDSRLSDSRTPTGSAGGDLTGTYPSPTIANNAVTAAKIANATITDTQVAAANKDGAAGTASMRTLGTSSTQAAAGNDSRLSDDRNNYRCRVVATSNVTVSTGLAAGQVIDGVTLVAGNRVLLAGQTTASENGSYTVPNSGAASRTSDSIKAQTEWYIEEGTTYADTRWWVTTNNGIIVGTTALTIVQFAPKDGPAATASLRTLGTGSTQAAAGNDSRLSDSRTPTGTAGGDLTGTYPNPTIANTVVTAAKIANGTITDVQVAAANKDGAAGTASMRTLGTASTQAAAGNDSRLSDARTPTAHKTTHATGGSDALAPSDIGAVPTTRSVNGHALSADVTVTASDVNAPALDGSSHLQLANVVAGEVLCAVWNGTNWIYNGSSISSRPTSRTDVQFLFIDPSGTATSPSFGISGDVFIQA